MRIVVLGNCQVHGIAHGLSRLLPDARIDPAQLDRPTSGAVALALIEGCDILVTQVLGQPHGRLRTKALAAAGHRVVPVPTVVFRGYQPDMMYLMVDGVAQPSPVQPYHSSIVAASFSLGVAEADVPMLFNRLVYARLGHFDAFGTARALLLEKLAAFGPDYAALFDAWHAEGPFMHTLNHPCAAVLTDIARVAAIGAGLAPRDAPRLVPEDDHLARYVVWPVYPEIAERLGVPGASMRFRRSGSDGAGIDLRTVIRQSYRQYRELKPEAFLTGQVGEARKVLATYLGCATG